MEKWRKNLLITLASVILTVLVATVYINFLVVGATRQRIITPSDAESLEGVDYIVVLGCGLRADGSPSDMLADRTSVGAQLQLLTDVPLLASGDHSRPDYDEVGAIAAVAVDMGVGEDKIFLDHAGFSTYESMYRAKENFGAEKVIIVTQEYHLYRAIYIARELGLDAYGVNADLRSYRGQFNRNVREVLARVKDFIAAKAKPAPTYTGDGLPY